MLFRNGLITTNWTSMFLISFLYGYLSSPLLHISYNCYIRYISFYPNFVRSRNAGRDVSNDKLIILCVYVTCRSTRTSGIHAPYATFSTRDDLVINSDIFIQLERPRFQIQFIFVTKIIIAMLSLDFPSSFAMLNLFFYDRVSLRKNVALRDVPRRDISRSSFGKG